VDRIAAASAMAFIAMLGVAAAWDPSIRALHAVEAIPYALAAILCLLRKKLGYLLGFASGVFWLWMAGTLTTFVRNGFERVGMLFTTGHVDRWDQLIAAPAALATGGLAVCSAWGYWRLEKKRPIDLVLLVALFGIVALFFVAIFWIFTPRYLTLFSRFIN
jgi:hypothetical protein